MNVALQLTPSMEGSNRPFPVFTIDNKKNIAFSEDEVVSGIKEGEKPMFSYLYDTYSTTLFGLIYRKVFDRHLAEDLLQEIFEKIWKNIHSYDKKKGRLYSWIFTLTLNHIIDLTRSRSFINRKKCNNGHEMDQNHHYSNQYDPGGFDWIGIQKKVIDLKPAYRRLINMAYFYGFTQNEIAIQLNIPIGTVKTHLRNAILELRKKTTDTP